MVMTEVHKGFTSSKWEEFMEKAEPENSTSFSEKPHQVMSSVRKAAYVQHRKNMEEYFIFFRISLLFL